MVAIRDIVDVSVHCNSSRSPPGSQFAIHRAGDEPNDLAQLLREKNLRIDWQQVRDKESLLIIASHLQNI